MSKNETSIGLEIKGHRLLELAGHGVFNNPELFGGKHFDLSGVPVRYDDTVATYALYVKGKPTKAQLQAIRCFVSGLAYAYGAL